jgi:CRP-like cAMP-binding protein
LTVTDDSGRSVQTGLVGPEACIGLDCLFCASTSMPDAAVQIEGEMSVIGLGHLRNALEARPPLNTHFLRSVYEISAQALQTIACNRLHSMLARCCRWLLMMHDAALGNDLPLTQETLATLVGSGRPRVNMLLANLERNGILRRYRGRIRVLKRSGLEKHACECYRVIRRMADPLPAADR